MEISKNFSKYIYYLVGLLLVLFSVWTLGQMFLQNNFDILSIIVFITFFVNGILFLRFALNIKDINFISDISLLFLVLPLSIIKIVDIFFPALIGRCEGPLVASCLVMEGTAIFSSLTLSFFLMIIATFYAFIRRGFLKNKVEK